MTSPTQPAQDALERQPIYVASRASLPQRGMMWRAFRDQGYRITSSWINEDGEGQSASLEDLWERIASEIAASNSLVLYAEIDDFPLKGALIEAGIALGMGKPIIVALPDVQVDPRSCRPIGSWIRHPSVTRINDIHAAIKLASGLLPIRAHSTEAGDWNERARAFVDDWLENEPVVLHQTKMFVGLETLEKALVDRIAAALADAHKAGMLEGKAEISRRVVAVVETTDNGSDVTNRIRVVDCVERIILTVDTPMTPPEIRDEVESKLAVNLKDYSSQVLPAIHSALRKLERDGKIKKVMEHGRIAYVRTMPK